MYNNCVASSSRTVSQKRWELAQERWSLPTSDVRSECRSSRGATPSDPLPQKMPAASGERMSNYLASTCYPTTVPQWVQIEPGVWSDGSASVLSATYPQVKGFLTRAREEMKLPPSPSEVIFVLAALEVFYRPGDPVHWMFWGDQHKNQTAEVVTRISLHRPPLIQSSVAWNGTPEYLSILATHHGSTWRQLFETQPWYPILAPPKLPSVPNLRKRRPTRVIVYDTSSTLGDDDGADVEEPPPKRPKAKRAQSPLDQEGGDGHSIQPASSFKKGKASPSGSSISLPEDDQSMTCEIGATPPTEDTTDQSERPVTKQAHSGKQKRKGQTSPTPELENSRSLSAGPATPTSTTVPITRNRSISQASAETLVGARRKRSLSALSAVTVVEVITGRKRKAMGIEEDVDGARSDLEEEDMETEEDEIEDSSSQMVTRGRAVRTAAAAKTTAPPAKKIPKTEVKESTPIEDKSENKRKSTRAKGGKAGSSRRRAKRGTKT